MARLLIVNKITLEFSVEQYNNFDINGSLNNSCCVQCTAGGATRGQTEVDLNKKMSDKIIHEPAIAGSHQQTLPNSGSLQLTWNC